MQEKGLMLMMMPKAKMKSLLVCVSQQAYFIQQGHEVTEKVGNLGAGTEGQLSHEAGVHQRLEVGDQPDRKSVV